MNEIMLTMQNENGEAVQYEVKNIFTVEGDSYCVAYPQDGNEAEAVFLKCSLAEHEGNTDISISDIDNAEEYNRVFTAYNDMYQESVQKAVYEELKQNEEIITVTDVNGENKDFLVHTIFEDTDSKRSYIAVQEVSGTGEFAEEISLYRYDDSDGEPKISMIPSDMEYDRVRKLFVSMIENS